MTVISSLSDSLVLSSPSICANLVWTPPSIFVVSVVPFCGVVYEEETGLGVPNRACSDVNSRSALARAALIKRVAAALSNDMFSAGYRIRTEKWEDIFGVR
jgi:hypothetical protein